MENIWYQENVSKTQTVQGPRQFYTDFSTGRISVALPSWAGETYLLPDPFKLNYILGCMNYGRVLRFWDQYGVYINELGECVVVDCNTLDTQSLLTKDLNFVDIKAGFIICISESGLLKFFKVPQLNSILQVQFPTIQGQVSTCLKWSNGILIATFFSILHSKSTIICCQIDKHNPQSPEIFEILEFDDPFPIHAIEMLSKPSDTDILLFDIVCISSVNQIQILRLSQSNQSELKLHRTLQKRIDDRPTKTGKGKKLSLAKQPADIRLIGLNHLISESQTQDQVWSSKMNGMPVEPEDLMIDNPAWSLSCKLTQTSSSDTISIKDSSPKTVSFPAGQTNANPSSTSQIIAELSQPQDADLPQDSQDRPVPRETPTPTPRKTPGCPTHAHTVSCSPQREADLFRVQVHGINYSRNVLI